MGIKKYDKLVRDKIPEIISSQGKKCCVEVMDSEAYLEMVDKKLGEELEEYYKDGSIEELADLLEVLYAAVAARGYTLDELERVRKEKLLKRGGFEKKLLLKHVEE